MKSSLLEKLILPMLILSLSVGVVIWQPASVNAFSATEKVIATGDGPPPWYSLTFTVTNDDNITDIVEFAIGNPDGKDAWIDSGSNNIGNGSIARKNESGNWSTYVSRYSFNGEWLSGYYRDLDWIEDVNSGFANSNTAFLFTSWTKVRDGNPNNGGFAGFLESGTTNEYYGTTYFGFSSPVAAYSLSKGTISGGEATVVPIPGAIWLFASGLIGFVGLRRKNN